MSANDAAAILSVLMRFNKDEVMHAVPALAFDMTFAAPELEIPQPIAELVRAWMAARGLHAQSPADDVVAALEATYQEKPIAQELKLALAEVLRALGAGDAGRGFRSFLDDGNAAAAVKGLAAASAPAPMGAHKATPLARFALKAPNDKT